VVVEASAWALSKIRSRTALSSHTGKGAAVSAAVAAYKRKAEERRKKKGGRKTEGGSVHSVSYRVRFSQRRISFLSVNVFSLK
jgi:hypothetical protein